MPEGYGGGVTPAGGGALAAGARWLGAATAPDGTQNSVGAKLPSHTVVNRPPEGRHQRAGVS